jgi:hypothetical protein
MKKLLSILLITLLVSTSANALFFDGPKSKCGPVSNAACNDDTKKDENKK